MGLEEGLAGLWQVLVDRGGRLADPELGGKLSLWRWRSRGDKNSLVGVEVWGGR